LQDIERNTVRVAPPPVVVATPKPAAAEPTTPARYRAGGNVRLGTLLHRIEPAYPAIAKTARVQGDVALECVVGTDGRIRDVKVTSGNPLLIKAAVDAAWQWVYGPSKLNDTPIEIITILTFSFKLKALPAESR
jgi:protein TonB